MRVLVACEYSGAVRDAFIAAGHDAMSCDLLPTETPGPHWAGDVKYVLDGWQPVVTAADCAECDDCGELVCFGCREHYADCACIGPTQDGMEMLYVQEIDRLFARPEESPHWDLMIAHPPCTYLSVSGMHWTTRGKRDPQLTEDALAFVRMLMAAPIPRICIENPVSVISTRVRKPDQIIQPWQFGHDASKTTCLWLKNLPLLRDEVANHFAPRLAKHDGKWAMRWSNQTDSGQNKLSPSDDRWAERSKTYEGIARAMATQWGALQGVTADLFSEAA